MGAGSGALKRVTDVLVGSLLLVATAPVQAMIAATIRARLGSPVLFRQPRAGRHGKPFTALKFRTMTAPVPGREGPESDAERLTPLGRRLRSSSLDELPTLWNVVRGDMSLVGPRPLLLRYVERYSTEQSRRLLVRPGITGWAQVNGRNAISWDEKFRLDCWYVDHASWLLDVRILLRTAIAVVRREGISSADTATMPEFVGTQFP